MPSGCGVQASPGLITQLAIPGINLSSGGAKRIWSAGHQSLGLIAQLGIPGINLQGGCAHPHFSSSGGAKRIWSAGHQSLGLIAQLGIPGINLLGGCAHPYFRSIFSTNVSIYTRNLRNQTVVVVMPNGYGMQGITSPELIAQLGIPGINLQGGCAHPYFRSIFSTNVSIYTRNLRNQTVVVVMPNGYGMQGINLSVS
ncbi:hypothetical protein J6590_052309 [Homalodisca vitripennis]|nr:hypothetical protein J6590_052309 [Homalodisca vitripennis]